MNDIEKGGKTRKRFHVKGSSSTSYLFAKFHDKEDKRSFRYFANEHKFSTSRRTERFPVRTI